MKLVFGNVVPEVSLEVTDVTEEYDNGRINSGITDYTGPTLKIFIRNTKISQQEILGILSKADLSLINVHNKNLETNEYELSDTIEGYTQLTLIIKSYSDSSIVINLIKGQ